MSDHSLEVESLLGDASHDTGLSDWGGDAFREPLAVLLKALREEARLTPAGQASIRHKLLRHAANRLRIQDAWKRHAEIHDVRVERPVFVVGLPRSGTTHMHKFLAINPAYRALQFWEMALPAPESFARSERIAQTEEIIAEMYSVAPTAKAIHFMAPTEPHECHELFENDFVSRLHDPFYRIPTYAAWLDQHDFEGTYRYHRLQLQMLTSQSPGARILLKDPLHIFDMEALFKVYPDARIIVMHRDPLKTVPSFCSLAFTVRRARSDQANPHEVGKQILEKLQRGITKLMQFRRTNAARAGQFCDVHYDDLMADPIGVARRVGDTFDARVTTEAADRMQRWLDEHPQNKHGVHRYGPEEFGLTERDVRSAFAEYCSTYDVRKES